MPRSPTVLIVEDHQLVRMGLRVSLERLGCCEVLGEVADGESAVRETQRLRPQVVLMDVGLPGIDGVEATWRIKQEFPRTRVVMFTSHTGAADVSAALGAGADGYCAKDAPVEQIARAIDAVMRSEVWLDPSIADAVVRNHGFDNGETGVALSDMDMQVLALIKEGLDNREIAVRLKTNTETIARVMHRIIHRFMEMTATAAGSQERHHDRQEFPDEWLTAFVKNLNEGTVFAEKYLVEHLLGRGGTGAVFKAKHLYMDRYVALKLLRPELSEDRLTMRNFQREAMAVANLQHKNIVGVHDFGLSPNHGAFLIMEYINGTNLAEILEEEKRLPVPRAINLCLQICAGLAEAHSRSIVHCDLKPGNILIVGSYPDEVVKLVDFGLAQVVPRKATIQSQLTDKLFVCGTPSYMSPEQCEGKQLDERSDIYSLGCILYEALTGVKIFAAESDMGTLAKHLQMTPPPLSSVYPEGQFSSQLEYCVSKMLAKDPARRPQSMEEVMVFLRSAAQHSQ